MKITSKYQTQIQFNNSDYARRYLSLPIKSYSILDSSFISRKVDTDNGFTLRLPLDTFYMSIPSPSGHILQLPSEAIIDIEVTPTPEEGTIKLSSKEIYFLYNFQSSSENGTDTISPPPWLVWNGDALSSNDVSMDHGLNLKPNQRIIRSSVQSQFAMAITWPLSDVAIRRKPWYSIPSFLRSRFPSSSQDVRDRKEESVQPSQEAAQDDAQAEIDNVLPVQASVRVVVDMNVPLRGNAAGIINFAPIKIILRQVGHLMVDSIIRIVSSGLTPRLLSNFDSRKQEWTLQDSLNKEKVLVENKLL